VWPFLTPPEQRYAYFDRSLDCPRSFDQLEATEARRQINLPLKPLYESYQLYDQPLPCWYQFNDHETHNAVAVGERQISAHLRLIRVHYQAQDGLRESDVNPKFIHWTDPPHDFERDQQLRHLEQERDRLTKEAEFSPDNGWIETGRVKGKDFRQAWWRGKYAQGKKTIYIGKVGSAEYGKARNAQQARKQLKKILRQIEQLKKGAAHAVS
jgi:hypothetical protein